MSCITLEDALYDKFDTLISNICYYIGNVEPNRVSQAEEVKNSRKYHVDSISSKIAFNACGRSQCTMYIIMRVELSTLVKSAYTGREQIIPAWDGCYKYTVEEYIEYLRKRYNYGSMSSQGLVFPQLSVKFIPMNTKVRRTNGNTANATETLLSLNRTQPNVDTELLNCEYSIEQCQQMGYDQVVHDAVVAFTQEIMRRHISPSQFSFV